MEPFKITLRAARVNCGLTTKEVAEYTGKCFDTINKYELDSTNIPHELMVSLLNLYKVPFSYIFFGRESEKLGFNRAKKSRRKTS
ncbi:helix-turn-helix domain-containing protein [Paenibacillus sp. EC2-1]|uniref:helix-turn-helix domain-containing protein n=1 Tax=Paenibacillus sp. EC2-1 TaxID=3388665 RepID=UPI003BEEFFD4